MKQRINKKVRKWHIKPRTFNRYVKYVSSFVYMFSYRGKLYKIHDDGRLTREQ